MQTKSNEEIHKLIVGTFETEIGKRLLEHLKKTLVDRPMYKAGMTIDQVAFRQGQADVITQILKEFEE